MAWIEERANVCHCALQLGVTESAMQRTAAYLGERKQFGVPLGSFQALAMRMADSYIDVEAIRSTYWLALWRLSEGLDARAEIRAAKWWACEAAHRVVCTAQHLHGGIGADVEYPIHRFYLLAKQISYSLGNAGAQLEKLGRLLASDDSLGFRALEV
jgi:alkylation response protein AidB-like acyl-CoA dehydrogenase